MLSTGGFIGEYASAARGPDGLLAVASTDGLTVAFGRCLNTACDERFYAVPVVSQGTEIQGTSLAFGVDGNPLISYQEVTSIGTVLRVFHCAAPGCF